ncbi:MAG TPA: methyltransferase domain-containing protein [Chitinophagaceae bacterium]|nr:methyltransferase domain-containing protein [Chitinophagaceae bacterium]
MKRIFKNEDWKENWKSTYIYDLLEVYNETDENLGYAYAYENRRNHTLELVKSVVRPGDKILDVAAAQGNFSLLLAELGYNVTWNDIRADMAEYVQMKYEKGEIRYVPGNVFEVNFEYLFDLILATEIIEHVAHPDEFLQNLATLVKPNGYIVISTPLGSYFKNKLPKFTEFENPEIFEKDQFKPNSDGHIFLIHLNEMLELSKKAGLEVVSKIIYTNPITNGHMGLKFLLKILPKHLVFKLDALTQKLPLTISKRIHTNFAVLLKKSG